ncbi:MAG TPA: sugar phosphate nucleotidyltransferase [Erythrobacter sp.]|nr:sugar phosphate nucleotidyltransferase [Erythrobacter sp.]
MSQSPPGELIHPVILCGGGGSRLWPRSRQGRPKPFLPLLGDQTLFQQALARCADRSVFADPLVVGGADHIGLIEAQAGHLGPGALIVEPAARNTAPAVALAAARLHPDAVMLVCPSDHHIADIHAFQVAATAAAQLAREGWLVSLAIAPDRAETGYGYIKRGETVPGGFAAARFVEKPSRAVAERFLAEGGYFWNGGIFAFRAGTLLEELALHRPDMASAVIEAVAQGRVEGRQFHPAAAPFMSITAESIDYAVLEHTRRAAMVPVAMGWSDIGNWASLADALPGDAAGNRVVGPAQLIDCTGVLTMSDGPRISVVGLADVCVVVDGDEVLVTSRAAAQQIGQLQGEREA